MIMLAASVFGIPRMFFSRVLVKFLSHNESRFECRVMFMLSGLIPTVAHEKKAEPPGQFSDEFCMLSIWLLSTKKVATGLLSVKFSFEI